VIGALMAVIGEVWIINDLRHDRTVTRSQWGYATIGMIIICGYLALGMLWLAYRLICLIPG
jgi:hypothetical protein